MYKTLLLTTGFISIFLAIIGAILPLLPTTPFVLLSAVCFSKSSNKFHTLLLKNKFFGSIIMDWENKRGMTLKTKLIALSSIILVGGGTVLFAIKEQKIQIIVALILLIPLVIVTRIKTL